jgi:hypothetical protein
MGTRLELQTLLEGVLGSDSVYFQPPPTIQMSYPCIVYNRSDIRIDHANNNPYAHKKRYMLTVIDRNPDSDIPDRVAELPSVAFERHYTADGLNHDIFLLFF